MIERKNVLSPDPAYYQTVSYGKNKGWNDCFDSISKDYILIKREDVPEGLSKTINCKVDDFNASNAMDMLSTAKLVQQAMEDQA